MNAVVYDLEIVNDIDPKAGIGWKSYDKMHVSVGVAFDYKIGDYRVFLEDNLQGLVDLLERADLVAAFNNKGFDNPLMEAEIKRLGLKAEDGFLDRLNKKSYDMLEESRLGWGWDPSKRFPTGFKLDEHLHAIWGASMAKTGDGADAPRFWREGKRGQVIDYCVADVRRERQLFEWAWYGGQFKCAGSNGHSVKRPQTLLGLPLEARLPYFGGQFSDKALTTILGQFKEHA